MTSEQFFFCCYNRSTIFFSGHVPCNLSFLYSNSFSEGEGGGLKLGLYVFYHNNNFDVIKIHSAKTITREYKKNHGSIYGVNKTIIWFQIHFLFFNFFFSHNVAHANFFLCPFGALQNFFFFFLQILPLPPPPPPPPRDNYNFLAEFPERFLAMFEILVALHIHSKSIGLQKPVLKCKCNTSIGFISQVRKSTLFLR